MKKNVDINNLMDLVQEIDPEHIELALNYLEALMTLSALTPQESMKFLTAKEVQTRLGLTHAAFVSLQEEVQLPRIKVGKSIRYPWLSVVRTLTNYADTFYEHSSFSDTLSIV